MINFLDRIKQFFAPIADEDVANKKYVDDSLTSKITYGTGDPPASAAEGDIYLKYEA